MSLKELKKNYIEFLENIPNYLKRVKELIGKEYLDYSFDEIEKVKEVYLEHYKTTAKINMDYKTLSNILYAYLGTAFVNYHGGNWELNDVKTDEAYGTPIIINWGGDDYSWTSISPYIWQYRLENGRFGDAKKVFG